jgi:hypothetical protein
LKKIIAICFAGILLFSTGGYHPFISLLQQKADRNLESLLDEEVYDESRLIEIRVPLNMPYQQRYTGYERHYGNIEVEGQSYTYVKKKIDGDVVIFQCIPNVSRQQLKDMRYDLTRANSNMATTEQGPQKQQQPSLIKNTLTDFDDQLHTSLQHKMVIQKNIFRDDYLLYLMEINGKVPHAPPEC